MPEVILLHSIWGLLPGDRAIAARLTEAGHPTIAPDLYGGRRAESVEDGFAIQRDIGWEALCGRAEAATADAPGDAVLAGRSMGVGVAGHLWAVRPAARGLLCLHGITALPADPRPGSPVQLHLAEPDPFEPEAEVAGWIEAAAAAGITLETFRYPGVGHLFTDPDLPDYDATAAEAALARAIAFLDRL